MTKLLQQALDALESCKVFDGKSEWDYFDLDKVAAAITAIKKALAQQEQPANRVYFVATGEVYEGQETYTRHDTPPPLCDYETLFTQAQQEQPAWIDIAHRTSIVSAVYEQLKKEFTGYIAPFDRLDADTVQRLVDSIKWMTQPAQEVVAWMHGTGGVQVGRNRPDERASWRPLVFGDAAPTQPAQDPIFYQYRWTNPGDNKDVSEFELDWKTVELRNPYTDTIESRIEELKSSRYNGKNCYEVRGLFAHPAPTQPAQKPDLWKTQFLTDVMTSAGLLRYGRTDKKLAQRIADGSARWRTELYASAPPQPAMSDEADKPVDRRTLQAEGKHPAPCARQCEANAFKVEIRRLESALVKVHNNGADWTGQTIVREAVAASRAQRKDQT